MTTNFKRKAIAALVAASLVNPVHAAPTLPQVVAGQASFGQQGNVFSITNTPNTIINWQSFSVNAGEITRFIQQSGDSAVLNRILGQDPSKILGALQSNGHVYLINPNGIVFGKDAKVDVNGLVASTLNISNSDFLAGKKIFSGSGGTVSNAGSINGSKVYLIGQNVENSGIITSPTGDVMLAAGHSVELVDSNNPDLHVVVSAPSDQAINLGQIVANRVGIYGALVNQRGVVNATAAAMEGGKVVFKASGDTLLEAGSVTSGHDVQVLGKRVALTGDASIDSDGGSVLIGGDWQGANPLLPNASRSFIGQQASIRNDGGKVVVWADDGTQFYGSIRARGGKVETSGKGTLDAAGGRVDAASWLLDPSDITITHGSINALTAGLFDPGTVSSIGDTQINAALNGGTDVTIRTSGGSGGTGIIKINGTADTGGAVAIGNSTGGSRSLTLSTSGPVTMNSGASISGSANNPLSVNMSGSAISIAGTIDNQGGTTAMTGPTTVTGTLRNGTLSNSGGIGATGFLDNMTLSGAITASGYFMVKNDLTLANGAALNMGSNSIYFNSTGTRHLATGGAASVTFAGGTLYAGYGVSGQTLNIDSGVTVQGWGNVSQSSVATIVNNGSIAATGAGQTMTVSGSTVQNNGSMNAAGGTLTLSPTTMVNAGSVGVTSGTLNLNYNTTTAGLGTINHSAGAVNFGGVLDNTSATVNLGTGGQFGALGLSSTNGTIKGGTINSTGGALPFSFATLDGVTLDGNFTASGGAYVKNNLVLAGGTVLNLGANSLYFSSTGVQDLSSPGSATVNLGGGALYAGYSVSGQTLRLGSGLTVQGYGLIDDSSAAPIINNGTIAATSAGHTLSVQGTDFTNAGDLNATSGTLTVAPTLWATRSGRMTVTSGGTLNLGMSTTTAALGTVSHAAGTVNYSGVLDNTSASVDLGNGGIFGAIGLTGFSGTIKNGTVTSTGGALPTNFGTFDGVTFSGALTAGGSMYVNNDLSFAAGSALDMSNNSIYLRTTGARHLATAGTATITLGGGTLYAGYGVSGQSLQIDSGMTIKGYGSISDSSTAPITNAGILDASSAGHTLTVNSSTLNNTGNLYASAGVLTLDPTNWSNSGTAGVGSGGTLNLNMSTTKAGLGIITHQGGILNVGGSIDNTAAVLDFGTGGSFGALAVNSFSGTVTGGTVKSTGGAFNTAFGTLDGVTLSGTLTASGGTYIKNDLTLGGGAVLNQGSNSLYFVSTGSHHIATGGSGTINLAGGSLYAGYGVTGQSLQIDSGVTVQGYGGIYDSSAAPITNAGAISAGTAGQTLTVAGSSFSNSGSLSANAGTLSVTPVSWTNTGSMAVAANATLTLHVNTTTAGLGTVSHPAGTVIYSGHLDNSGATLDLGSGGIFGALGLSSLTGSITGGTVLSTGAALNTNSGALDNVTLGGLLTASGALFLDHDLKLANGAVLDMGNNNLYFRSTGSNHISTAGASTVKLGGGALYAGYGASGQTLQIDSGVTVQGYGGIYDSTAASVVNAGTIDANVASQTLNVQPTTFSNSGSLNASAGTLNMSPVNWTNTGSMAVAANATLTLHVNTTTAGLGTVSHPAGTVVYSGHLDNSGATLDLGSGGIFGALGLSSLAGSITGGTVLSTGAALNTNSGALDNVTLGGLLTASGSLFLDRDLKLANGAVLDMGNNNLYFRSTGSNHISTAGASTVKLGGGALYAGYGASGQTLQIDSGVTVQGYGGIYDSTAASVVNAGAIDANVAGQTLNVQPTTFSNSGSAGANAGTLYLRPGTMSNSGSLGVSAGATLSLNYDSTTAGLGTIGNAGGSISYTGVLDNSGATLNVGSGGQFGAAGLTDFSGTIKNGTVQSGGGVLGLSFGTFDGVTISGALTSSGSAIVNNGLTLANGSTLAIGNGSLYFGGAGTQHIATAGNATLSMANGGLVAGYGIAGQTLQIDSGVTVQGYGHLGSSSAATVVNAGTIHSDTASQNLSINPTTFTNTGTLRVSAGTMSAGNMPTNDGAISIASGTSFYHSGNLTNSLGATIGGSGILDLGGATLTNQGTIAPGGSGAIGTLDVYGSFINGSTGLLAMEAGGASSADRLAVSNLASLGGTLDLSTIGSYVPAAGDNYLLLSASASPTGTFANVSKTGFAGATDDYATANAFYVRMPAVAQPNVWNFDGSGLWTDPSKWSLGHVPAAGETVQVPDYTSLFTITVNAVVPTVGSLVFAGNDVLAINGGSVGFSSASSIAGGGLNVLGNGFFSVGNSFLVHDLNLASGSIGIAAAKTLTVTNYVQSGGALSGPGSLTIGGSYQRTGGSIASLGTLSITQLSGTLATGALAATGPISLGAASGNIDISGLVDAGSSNVALAASQGAINQLSGALKGGTVTLVARDGIGAATPVVTQTSALVATNTTSNGSAAIQIVNTGALTLGNVSQGGTGNSGAINIDNTGALTVGAGSAVSTAGGAISLSAHSPLTVSGSVTSTSGDITLLADNDGALTVDSSGSVATGTGAIALTGGTITTVGTVSSNNVTRRLTIPTTPPPPPAPTVSQCLAAPSTTGCTALLADLLASCTSDPTGANCAAVLPTVATCVANPAAAGCTAVLPSLATCATAPTTAGCSVVLPSLATCVATPAATGCSAVLPTLASCIATPTAAGCSVVLPALTTCIATPTATGCAVVLPTLASCIASPTAAGCSVVLPTLAQCVVNPAAAGCTVVLPTLAACIASPTAAGCSVVLPSLSSCIAAPATSGCAVVLPTLATCIATPATAGCGVVLPSLSACIASPTTPGCGVVLPTLAQCTASPTLQGCSVVLPPLSTCAANPAASGCTAVVPTPSFCETNPQDASCKAIDNGDTPGPVAQAIQTTVNVINTVTDTESGGGNNDKKSDKATKAGPVAAATTGAKNEAPPKLYCN